LEIIFAQTAALLLGGWPDVPISRWPMEALNKCLEYGPAGTHAAAVRDMITQLNKPVETTY
jgi:hypothetical protein